jgi:Rrf2 family protein
MHTNSRFAVAIHALALAMIYCEERSGTPVTSERMAESVNTNPVVLRRLLGALRDAGLVKSQPGPRGGWLLARPPEEITLGDVYRAVQDEPILNLPPRNPNQECLVGSKISCIVTTYFQAAEAALEAKLDRATVADVIEAIQSSKAAGGAYQLDYLDMKQEVN